MRLSLLLIVVLAGCGVRAGDPCRYESICDGTGAWLHCSNGKFERYLCTGPLGCSSKTDGSSLCDFRDALPGTACPTDVGALAVCTDATHITSCTAGTWAAAQTCASCTTDDQLKSTATGCR